MALPTTDEATFLALYEQHGRNATELARALGVSLRNTQARLARIERDSGVAIRPHKVRANVTPSYRPNVIDMPNGTFIAFSDAHFQNGDGARTPAFRGLVKLCKILAPDMVMDVGDSLDGATISRHGPLGWHQPQSMKEELEACRMHLEEIRHASRGATHLACLGNHDDRLANYLANNAAALRGVAGMTLDEQLPGWSRNYAWFMNNNTLFTHKIRNGIHATWSNVQETHTSVFTGHSHKLILRPRTTLSPVNNNTVWSCETGTLANPWSDPFTYAQQGPRDWMSGFVVGSVQRGIPLPPEIAWVVQDGDPGEALVFFRGQLIAV